jgi:hypothetical protein
MIHPGIKGVFPSLVSPVGARRRIKECVRQERKCPTEEGWMQALEEEMNLSETAYVYPVEEGFNLRWFTPAAEVDLCGEGTRCWFSRPS